MDVSGSREGCLALRAGARSPGLCLGTHGSGALSSHLPLVSPPRGWWWSRPPGAPAHLISACSISTRCRPTTR